MNCLPENRFRYQTMDAWNEHSIISHNHWGKSGDMEDSSNFSEKAEKNFFNRPLVHVEVFKLPLF